MNCRSFYRATILVAIFYAPPSKAQAAPLNSNSGVASIRAEGREKEDDSSFAAGQPLRKSGDLRLNGASAPYFHKKQFVILSSLVYAASAADMHQTLHNRKYFWWYEADPLARPFVRLPAPAYYAAGLTLATGINWFSWKMGHSRRWHKLAPIPQLLSIVGNTYGVKSNHYPNY